MGEDSVRAVWGRSRGRTLQTPIEGDRAEVERMATEVAPEAHGDLVKFILKLAKRLGGGGGMHGRRGERPKDTVIS